MRGAPTLHEVLTRSFIRHRGRPCVLWEGGSATYEETGARVAAIAAWIQARTTEQDHVAILLGNCREYIEILLACMAAGRARVPLNGRDPLAQQVFKLQDSQAGVLFTTHEWWEQLRDAVDGELPKVVLVGGGDNGGDAFHELLHEGVAFSELARSHPEGRTRLTYTGGTTGKPKAVVQTHARELAVARNLLLEAFRPSTEATFVAATPLSHASGAFILPTMLMGGSMSWTSAFEPERLVDARWLEPGRQTQTFLVPTALDDLSGAAKSGRNDVDTVIYGGAVAPQAVIEHGVEQFGSRLVQVYGQAEAPMTITLLNGADHDDPAHLEGCAGRPFLFVDLRLAAADGTEVPPGEVGEVQVAGEHVMHGYWQNEESTREAYSADGYLRTQDLGRFDEQNRLWLVGRSRELIISGGYNVYPAQVERQLGTVSGIRSLAVFGAPHPRWGEGVVVAIVPDGRSPDAAKAAVTTAADTNLAAYERPKEIVVLDELPKTPVGKVSRVDLSTRFADIFDDGAGGTAST